LKPTGMFLSYISQNGPTEYLNMAHVESVTVEYKPLLIRIRLASGRMIESRDENFGEALHAFMDNGGEAQ
jgi:hypothetical protein